MKKFKEITGAIIIGIVNSVVGSGGGILAVENLSKIGLSVKKSHATAISVILPLTIINALIYYRKGYIDVINSIIYIIPGILGALFGAKIMLKIKENLLSKAFAVFIIYAGLRMFLK